MGIGGSYTTLGQKYYLGMHLAICQYPIDQISTIRAGDINIYETPITTNTTITIDKPKIWGGPKQGGGIEGDVDIELGGASQTENAYLQGVLETNDIPGFRGVVCAVLNQVYLASISPTIKAWSFLIQWLDSQSCGPNSLDMNPAHMVQLAITETWGLNADSADVDSTSFTAAKTQLGTEQLGLSYVYNSSTPIEEFIARILQHIMGVCYTDPETGKFTIGLMRNGDASQLTLDETNIIEIRRYHRPQLSELANRVIAHYVDRGEADHTITLDNQGLIEQMGGIINAVDIEYEMCVESATIQKLAARDLRNLSTPLSVAEIVANREANVLRLGQVFTLSWDKYNITSETMRVTNIDYGSLQDGQVRIEAVQDIYGVDTALYAAPPATKWTTPYNDPAAVTNRLIFEVPYYLLVQRWGESDTVWGEIDNDAGWVNSAAEKPSSDSQDYEMWTKGSAYEEVFTAPFCPTATLDEALDKEVTTTTTVTEVYDLDLVETGTYCIIAGSTIELAEVTAIDSDTGDITLKRGVMDTVPQEHLVDTLIYFAETWTGEDPTERYSAETVYVKLLPTTSLGTLDIGDANEDNITLDDRLYRPYPPGNFELNSEAWPLFITGELVITWAHRDRLTQTAGYTQQDTGDIGPEAGTTYTVKIYDEDSVLRVNQTGLAVTTYTYDLATEISDLGKSRPNEEMRVIVTAVRDGFDNWQSQDYSIPECRGYGMFYGAYYGE